MKNTLLFSLFALGVSTHALAEDDTYVGLALGSGEMLGLADFASAQRADDFTATANGIKAFVGQQINRHLAFELSYTDLGKYTMNVSQPNVITREWTISAISFDAVGMLPVGENFFLFAKLGYAFTSTTLSKLDIGASVLQTQSKDVIKYGLGGEYVFGKEYGVRLEYELYPKVGGDRADLASDVSFLSLAGNMRF